MTAHERLRHLLVRAFPTQAALRTAVAGLPSGDTPSTRGIRAERARRAAGIGVVLYVGFVLGWHRDISRDAHKEWGFIAGPTPVCGDKRVTGDEVCDPPGSLVGTPEGGAVCDADCRSYGPGCGDTMVFADEVCDPPGSRDLLGRVCAAGCQARIAAVDSLAASTCGVTPTGGPNGRDWTGFAERGAPMFFVGLSAGRYCRGSPAVDSGDEHPQHTVRVSAFLLGKSEVTAGQWNVVVTAAKRANDAEAAGLGPATQPDNHPAGEVSWCDAARFANVASRLAGLGPAYTVGDDCEKGGYVAWNRDATGFRLPTEAEWEYAARAGSTAAFATGGTEAALARVGWYEGNSDGSSHDVCTAPEKPWGLCDLHGNHWEWVWDWHDGYSAAELGDPAGPASGVVRVQRGGAWDSDAIIARSAFRFGFGPSYSRASFGLRLVLPSVPPER